MRNLTEKSPSKYDLKCNKIQNFGNQQFITYSFNIKSKSHIQVSGFLRVLRFPPPIKLTPRYNWNIFESGIKQHHWDQTNKSNLEKNINLQRSFCHLCTSCLETCRTRIPKINMNLYAHANLCRFSLVCLYLYCCYKYNYQRGWVEIKPATFLFLSQARTWISNFICRCFIVCSVIWGERCSVDDCGIVDHREDFCFFSYFTDFSYFSLKNISETCRTLVRTGQKCSFSKEKEIFSYSIF